MTEQPDEPARRAKAARRASKAAPAADNEASGSRALVEHHLEQAAADWPAQLGRIRPDPDAALTEPGVDPISMHG